MKHNLLMTDYRSTYPNSPLECSDTLMKRSIIAEQRTDRVSNSPDKMREIAKKFNKEMRQGACKPMRLVAKLGIRKKEKSKEMKTFFKTDKGAISIQKRVEKRHLNSLVEHKCDYCGKLFRRIGSLMDRYPTKKNFCSKECYHNHTVCGKQEYTCLSCGSVFIRQRSSIKHSITTFCSRNCMSAYRRKYHINLKSGR